MSSTPASLSTAALPVAPARPRRRPGRWIVTGLVFALATVVAFGVYVSNARRWEVEAAVAEADRLDPGWRIADLEAAREVVPDAENSAPLVLAAAALRPPGAGLAKMPDGTEVTAWLNGLTPKKPLDAAESNALRAEVTKFAPALGKARELADRPRGHYHVVWDDDYVGTRMAHLDRIRPLAQLLIFDALVRSADGDVDGAVRSCQAVLNVGRSLGDEPCGISQRVRGAIGMDAVRALERVLADGTPGAKSLESLQALLTEEGNQPLALREMRSARVGYYQSLDLMRNKKFNRKSFNLRSSRWGATVDEIVDQFKAARSEAEYVRWCNALVEAAKRPTEEQEELVRALPEPKAELPALIAGLTLGTDMAQSVRRFNRDLAKFRCAAAALAAERYRQAENHWPERLDDLVPKYLDAVPADPFVGQPLRLRRLPDGIVIYSVGPDRVDHGGQRENKNPQISGADLLLFQLWDVRNPVPAPPAK